MWRWVCVHIFRRRPSFDERPFKEFIYLDEISVVSLLASRVGELTEEIQEGWTQEDTLASESGANIGIKDVGGLNGKSSFQTKSSQSVQATRKANIQSKFRRLHREARSEGIVFPTLGVGYHKSPIAFLGDPKIARAIDAVDRGMLVELDVELSADPLFDKASILTEVAEIGEAHPDILGGAIGGLLPGQMKSFGKLLDRFMAGLVPIRCKVLNVGICAEGSLEYLVDKAAAESQGLHVETLELVGVLEKDRFWKDIRRVLFSESSVTVLGRVSVAGLQQNWTPIKLLDLFRKTIPGSDQLVSALESLNFDNSSVDSDVRKDSFGRALRRYAELWISDSGLTLTSDQGREVDRAVDDGRDRVQTAEGRRGAFRSIAMILRSAGVAIAESRDVDFRQNAMQAEGIDAFGHVHPGSVPTPPSLPPQSIGRLIEVEVVAMYW
ncbi:DUF6414 family protein [Gordonia asplenii]|uniref:DUF6414 family protein n=1 Tax=Gordonia asplenii TaxID=2725283 RepID=UPI00406BA8B9